jgi:hypothetical protein
VTLPFASLIACMILFLYTVSTVWTFGR